MVMDLGWRGRSCRSRMNRTSEVESVVAMSVRYRVPVWLAENRDQGQKLTESLLLKYCGDVCKRFEGLQKAIELPP